MYNIQSEVKSFVPSLINRHNERNDTNRNARIGDVNWKVGFGVSLVEAWVGVVGVDDDLMKISQY